MRRTICSQDLFVFDDVFRNLFSDEILLDLNLCMF
jgi:hypothetical protein